MSEHPTPDDPGYLKFRYKGPSMRPTFKPGEVLYARPALRAIEPGDVVVYKKDDLRVVHRVVRVVEDGVTTRGDNNPTMDEGVISFDRILGVVEKAEDWDQARTIVGGERGAVKAATRWQWKGFLNQLRPVIGAPYRWLKARGWVARFWRPRVTMVRVNSDDCEVVKYVVEGKTVATYNLSTGRFTCSKPYDLVISPPGRRG